MKAQAAHNIRQPNPPAQSSHTTQKTADVCMCCRWQRDHLSVCLCYVSCLSAYVSLCHNFSEAIRSSFCCKSQPDPVCVCLCYVSCLSAYVSLCHHFSEANDNSCRSQRSPLCVCLCYVSCLSAMCLCVTPFLKRATTLCVADRNDPLSVCLCYVAYLSTTHLYFLCNLQPTIIRRLAICNCMPQ